MSKECKVEYSTLTLEVTGARKELEGLLAQNGYSITENVTLEDLNSLYFGPVDRALSEDQIFKLEHFVIARNKIE